jgi:hypothetical protein
MTNVVVWYEAPYGLVRTEVSEVRIASIIRVTRLGKVGTTLAVSSANVVPSSSIFAILIMEAIYSSKKSVLQSLTQRHIPEDIL